MRVPECPSCRATMDEGFMIDRGHANAVRVGEWLEGAPEPSFWTGLKVRGKERLVAVTYRCAACGLLQSYAHQSREETD